MKFTPVKKTERSALANHKDWHLTLARQGTKVLIKCTCHLSIDPKSDLRWVEESQLLGDQ